MYRKYLGFTLIELVIVIVILGILAVVAFPQFVDLSGEAKTAAVQGVAGALSSASSINYASRKQNGTLGVAVSNCQNVAGALAGGTLPSGYSITSAAVASNATVNCTVTYIPSTGTSVSATFTATGVP